MKLPAEYSKNSVNVAQDVIKAHRKMDSQNFKAVNHVYGDTGESIQVQMNYEKLTSSENINSDSYHINQGEYIKDLNSGINSSQLSNRQNINHIDKFMPGTEN